MKAFPYNFWHGGSVGAARAALGTLVPCWALRSAPARRVARAWLALLAVFALALSARAGALSEAEVMDLYSQGKDLFRQANEAVKTDPDKAHDLYGKALLRFERIVREGNVHNGRLFYNIGNIHFRRDDIGRAILNYRRALLFIPNDVNLQQNLDFARSRRLDRIEEKQETKVLRTVFFWHYDVSTQARSFLFVGCWLAFWTLLGLRILVRRTVLAWGLAITGLLGGILLTSLLTDAVALRNDRPGVIVSREVVARKGDSETYEKSFTEPLHAGTEFRLREDRGEWVEIELADGRTCWVPAKSAEMVR